MGAKWLRGSARWAAALVLLLVLSEQGSVRTSVAQPAGAGGQGVPGAEPGQTAAQKESADPTQTTTTIRVESRLVTTPVTVFDSAGQFVYDVQQDEFKIYDNDALQRIAQFGTEMRPVALVIVVETNDTTAPLLEDVRPLGSLFSELVMGPQGQAALITYSDRVDLVQDFTTNGDKLDTALRGIKGGGSGMHLDDALVRALGMLEKRPKEDRRVAVVFSDGMNIGSQMTKGEIVKRAMNSDVTVYGLGFNTTKGLWSRPEKEPRPDLVDMAVGRPTYPNMPPTPSLSQDLYSAPIPVVPILLATGETVKSTVFKNSLEYFAGYSGGVYYQKWGKSTVQQTLNRIATEIHGQYELAYYPDNLKQTGFHRIVVQVRRPGAKVRARAGYYYYQGISQ
jgi:VWFA-related protein